MARALLSVSCLVWGLGHLRWQQRRATFPKGSTTISLSAISAVTFDGYSIVSALSNVFSLAFQRINGSV